MTAIQDGEDLLRSVPDRPECYGTDSTTGTLKISASAFNDPGHQPSVNRSEMLMSVEAAKLEPSHGLVKLVAHEVRAIKLEVIGANGKPNGSHYVIDAVHRPVDEGNAEGRPPNPAHSQVESAPALNRSRFQKLKERLAQLATLHGWIVTPTPNGGGK